MIDVEIRRMVDYIVGCARERIDDDADIAPESMTAIREAAKTAHAAWKAKGSEEVPVVLTGLIVGGKSVDIDESFDPDDLEEIFSGEFERQEGEAAVEDQKHNESESENAKEKERKRLDREEDEEEARKNARKTKQWIYFTFAIAWIGAGIVYVGHLQNKAHETHDDKTEVKPRDERRAAAATPTSTPTVAPRAPAHVTVSSCTCISRANGKNTFVLEAPATVIDDWHVDWNQQAGFQSMHSGFVPGASDAGAVASLASGATKLRAAMACENEILAVVAGDVASAWSATESGELLWTRKLPTPMAESSDAGSSDDVSCAAPLSVTGNVFTVPLAKGKKIALSIRDGSVHSPQ